MTPTALKQSDILTIPARRGRAARLSKGQSIKIINTHGSQVVDTWCFNAEDMGEFLSNEHMRPTIGTIFPRQGISSTATAAVPFSFLPRTPRPASTTRSLRPAMTTAMACSAARSIMITARTICMHLCARSA